MPDRGQLPLAWALGDGTRQTHATTLPTRELPTQALRDRFQTYELQRTVDVGIVLGSVATKKALVGQAPQGDKVAHAHFGGWNLVLRDESQIAGAVLRAD